MSVLNSVFRVLFGSQQERDLKSIIPIVKKINSFRAATEALSDEALRAKTDEFRGRIEAGETLDDLLPEAFACVREAGTRTIGLTHFDVQMIGGIALHRGSIAEMGTGEGKTLVATLPLYLNALSGKGAFLVTVNDYLARRDASWMAPIYEFLGLTVGCIQNNMDPATRREEYGKDITYGTNAEFGFDYLRDNMVVDPELRVQRNRNFAIVDEVDSILIDEARTPLIISGPATSSSDLYEKITKIVPKLTPSHKVKGERGIETWDQEAGDYAYEEKDKIVMLTTAGIHKVEGELGRMLGQPSLSLYDGANVELVHQIHQALKAHVAFRRDRDYIVQEGKVIIVDENTGRAMAGRRYSDGLHQALEAKEGLSVEAENQTYASITLQNYFRMFDKLAGMTGTADTEAEEFGNIYGLKVIVIPPNKPNVRDDQNDRFFATEKEKFTAIANDVAELHKSGQPILLGTISVEKSELLSKELNKRKVKHSVLNAKHHEQEANIIQNAGKPHAVTIATNMAGRGTDIKLTPESLGAGGLFVIGTERHDSRRIDNQLRGRSGRQGDPGASRFYLSTEDTLMRFFGNVAMIRRMMKGDGEHIEARMLTRTIAKAQKRVESRNFETRKNLLEYDDVMNKQRIMIYGLRDKVLFKQDLEAEVDLYIGDVVDSEAADLIEGRKAFTDDEREAYVRILETEYGLPVAEYPDLKEDSQLYSRNTMVARVEALFRERYAQQKETLGEKDWADVERFIFLRTVDQRWREHLFRMDALKEGIHLRAYQQVQPLTEYKREGARMFEDMLYTLRASILAQLLRVRVRVDYNESMRSLKLDMGQAQHRGVGQFQSTNVFGQSEAAQARAQQRAAGIKQKPVRVVKVGRNDPCPCGSGKKYKNCHGKPGAANVPEAASEAETNEPVGSGR